ncbi:MAG TPA: DUF3857 domain-containing protein [Flavisolibacter sp.]
MKECSFFLFLSLFWVSAKTQTGPYSLKAVSEELKSKASVITHLEDINLEIESLDKATLTVKKVFTVLNEEGVHALFFNQYSSKFVSLDNAEIRVFDQNGKQVSKYKKKDMITAAVGEGLIEDGYITYYRVQPSSFPFTVEFSYEQKFRGTFLLPDYRFITSKESVIESSYTARVPADMKLRYKAKYSSLSPVITEEGKYKIYKWRVNNLASLEDEVGSVSRSERFPYVNIVTDQFSYYGIRGDLSSWKSFGTWINELYNGLDALPADRQQFFKSLVNDATSENEKIRRIYKYMQENFRYVSIQLGIGGLKPFSASFTDQKKYGDCKALSNYMKAALNTVGIRSHVAIINADYDQEPVDPDFPSNNFNHVILCVPRPNDSIWLECTSSTAEFNTLGTATENRNALLITEDGGVLVPTPKSEASANQFSTYTTVSIEEDLSAAAETKIGTRGEFSGMVADLLKRSKDEQKEVIVRYLGYKQPDFFYLSASGPSDKYQAELKMSIRRLSEFNSGLKYFVPPRINKMWTVKLPSGEKRKLDYYFHHPFEKRDTTIIKLGAVLKPDVLPKEKELNTPYGFYHSRSWYNDKENAIYTATTFILKKHKVLAADYRTVKSFFDQVVQEDAQRIVLLKTETKTQEKKPF